MQKTFHISELHTTAEEILQKLVAERTRQLQNKRATIVALSGDLGAGKTTLTQSIAKHLGVIENVASPTFVIMKSYPITKGDYRQLVHIDAYRLNSTSELLKLGWDALVSDPNNLIIIEWPERVPEAITPDAHRITLTHIDDELRSILHEL